MCVKRGGKRCVFKYVCVCVSASVCLCEGCVQAPPSARVWHLTCDVKHLNSYNQGVSLKHTGGSNKCKFEYLYLNTLKFILINYILYCQ